MDETGQPVPVLKEVDAPYRAVNLITLFRGAEGVFYAFTNLESEREQDVVLAVNFTFAFAAKLFDRYSPLVKRLKPLVSPTL